MLSFKNVMMAASAALLCGAVPGCATTGASAPYEPERLTTIGVGSLGEAGAPGVRRFALLPKGRVVRSLPGRDPAQTRAVIERAIADELSSRGYAVGPVGGADRVIAYAAGATGTLDDESLNEVFGISPGLDGPGGGMRGALVMAILAPSGEIVWRGSVQARLHEAPSPEERAAVIRRAVRSLLSGLPARSG